MAKEDIQPATKGVPAQPAVIAVNAAEVIEAWAGDVVANIPELRETGNYNKFRAAVDDIKTRLQP